MYNLLFNIGFTEVEIDSISLQLQWSQLIAVIYHAKSPIASYGSPTRIE